MMIKVKCKQCKEVNKVESSLVSSFKCPCGQWFKRKFDSKEQTYRYEEF